MSEVWTKLRAVLSLDPAEFKAGAKQVESATTTMQGVVAKAAGAMGVAFSAAAVFNYAKELAKAADATVDAAKGLDITTAALVGLQRVAAQQGTEGDSVIRWLQKLADSSADISTSGGAGELGSQLEAMGISVRDFLGLPLPERLMLLVEKANESALGISVLNGMLGRGAALEVKEAYTDLARDGLGSITEEANRAAKAAETLASVWSGGEKGTSGFKNWISEKGANLVDMNRLFVNAGRGGGPAPTGMGAIAEGVASGAGALGMNLVNLVSPRLANKLTGWLQDAAGKPKGAGATGSWAPTDEQVQFDKAEGKRVQSRKAATDKAIQALRDGNSRLRIAALEGEEKIQAELADARRKLIGESDAAQKEMEEQLAAEKNVAMRKQLWEENAAIQNALQEKLRILESNAKKELAIVRDKAEQERQTQLSAILDPVMKAEQNLEERRLASSNIRGQGVNADALARVGGFFGGERPGLAVADRQLRVQQDILAAVNELKTARTQAEIALGTTDQNEKWW